MDDGRFGKYGGIFAPEPLMHALEELEESYHRLKEDEEFNAELDYYLREYAGRPTPLTFCANFSEHLGCKVYLKREDLMHGGAHKLNNTLGQALLAKHMGKERIIAETGAGQHGLATAIAGAVLGIDVEVYMGEEDIRRQKLNVFRMGLCGAKLIPVTSGSRTLKDAVNEALRDWITNVENTYYLLGSVVGPHPYPTLVRDFQRVIGIETKKQILEKEGRLPTAILACVGGGSNAIGIFHEFIPDESVRLIGIEAAGEGVHTERHSAPLVAGSEGVLHGALSYLIQDEDGQVGNTHSVAAGLDYPGVGPEHSMLKDVKRAEYVPITDEEALHAFDLLSAKEGIIPALESAHAVAYALKLSEELDENDIMVINLSGRGDKDVVEVARLTGREL